MEAVRYCIVNGEEIRECMGRCLARDVLDCIYGKIEREDVREISERGMLILERRAGEVGYENPWNYLNFLLAQPNSRELIRSLPRENPLLN